MQEEDKDLPILLNLIDDLKNHTEFLHNSYTHAYQEYTKTRIKLKFLQDIYKSVKDINE